MVTSCAAASLATLLPSSRQMSSNPPESWIASHYGVRSLLRPSTGRPWGSSMAQPELRVTYALHKGSPAVPRHTT